MTSKILKFENKTLLFIQIEKKSIANYNMATITAEKNYNAEKDHFWRA